ncbi:tetratricopeptide repeat protein [Chitinispirillales bacterium ANBcel5]|uniref:tetratricopeptide repeat protein n=1 Tax=Cellulosispirillum alkaliphilum TaxID=3039283 RepID=UPI002A4EAA7B|nr:tetratricopeptide repeat protein [Chitinispirillales bacterium ANBcel5]
MTVAALRVGSVIVLFCLFVTYGGTGKNLARGNQYYQSGQYNKAIAAYKRALNEGENSALSRFNLANAYYQIQEYSRAIGNYKAATLEATDFTRAWINLGVMYHEMGDHGASIAALEQARRLEAEDVMVYQFLLLHIWHLKSTAKLPLI